MLTDSRLQRFVDYNTDKLKDATHLHNISEKISIDVKKSLADSSLYFGDCCLFCKASSSEVSFSIGITLKSDLIWQSHSKVIDFSDILKIDAHSNQSEVTLQVWVRICHNDFEVISASDGQGKIKNSIIAEDKSGHIYLRLFITQISKLTCGKTYKLSHMVLKQFQGTHCMHTSKDSKITVITDLQIDSKGKMKMLIKHNLSITVQDFTSVKDFHMYYLCSNCKGKINSVQENVKTALCSCGSTTKETRLS